MHTLLSGGRQLQQIQFKSLQTYSPIPQALVDPRALSREPRRTCQGAPAANQRFGSFCQGLLGTDSCLKGMLWLPDAE